MLDPKETNQTNEELSEELSTDELKSVSGGVAILGQANGMKGNNMAACSGSTTVADFKSGHGTGSGMTLKDWQKSNDYLPYSPDDPIFY